MIHLNGKLISEDTAQISVYNRGFQYGDALFETIRVINNKIMFWEAHYFRLMSSMRILRMEIPNSFSPEQLADMIHELVETNNLSNQAIKVKINVFRDAEGLYLPSQMNIGYLITTSPIPSPFFVKSSSYCEVELFKDHYITSGLLSTLKTNNKVTHILASIYAHENEYNNCLMINDQKKVIETTNGNLFLVKDNIIKTPPLTDGCLNGIIRKQLIEIIQELDDFQMQESSISPFELQKADELFYTNAIQGIVSINKFRKKEYNTKSADQLIGKLNAKARFSDN